MKGIDIVFPQYYEWYEEMEKIAKHLGGAPINPDHMLVLHEETKRLFCSMTDFLLDLSCPAGKTLNDLCATEARVGEIILQVNQDLIHFFAMIAYLNALRHSHDIETIHMGDKITVLFFRALYYWPKSKIEGIIGN